MRKESFVAVTFAVFLLSLIAGPSTGLSEETRAAELPAQVKSEIPADSDQYIIGPEDVLFINVWKEDGLTKTVTVRIDGKISLPLVDEIHAVGLTPLQLKEELLQRLKGFVENPTVSVMVMEANSFKVYVSGEVKNPGVQLIRSEVTMLRLITMVGGFTEWANKKNILVIRKENGKDKRIIANYNDIVDGEQPDIVIQRGDMVIVR